MYKNLRNIIEWFNFQLLVIVGLIGLSVGVVERVMAADGARCTGKATAYRDHDVTVIGKRTKRIETVYEFFVDGRSYSGRKSDFKMSTVYYNPAKPQDHYISDDGEPRTSYQSLGIAGFAVAAICLGAVIVQLTPYPDDAPV